MAYQFKIQQVLKIQWKSLDLLFNEFPIKLNSKLFSGAVRRNRRCFVGGLLARCAGVIH
jgi:hypothetical protein